MDARAARRAAEKAARDLISQRAARVGDLGVLRAERAQLADDVTTAQAQGQHLVAAAQAEAGALVQAARDLALDGEQRYADAYSAATAAGWIADDLAALGYQPAQTKTRSPRRRQPSPVDEAFVTSRRADGVVPAQAHQPDACLVQDAGTPLRT